MNYRHLIAVLMVFMAAACAKKANVWDDIDYSKVKNRSARENDSTYTPPSVYSCVDDDLYNCK